MQTTKSISLFFFPYSGGNEHAYTKIQSYLPKSIECITLSLPGRGARAKEPFLKSIASAVEDLLQNMRCKISGPCAFFGHSLGGILAFETARHLKSVYGINITHLFISSCNPPCQFTVLLSGIHLKIKDDIEIIRWLKILGGTPIEVFNNKSLLLETIKIVKQDFYLLQQYVHHASDKLSCSITVTQGNTDHFVRNCKDWEFETYGLFQHKIIHGNHFYYYGKEQKLASFISSTMNIDR